MFNNSTNKLSVYSSIYTDPVIGEHLSPKRDRCPGSLMVRAMAKNFKNFTVIIKTRQIETEIQVIIKYSSYSGLIISDFGRTGNTEIDQALEFARDKIQGEIHYEINDLICGMIMSMWLMIAAQKLGSHINIKHIH